MITLRISVKTAVDSLKWDLEYERGMDHPSIERKNRILNQLCGINLILVGMPEFSVSKEEIDGIIRGLREEILQEELEKIGV